MKMTKKYVQPPRVKPFLPVRVLSPPTEKFESKTTYNNSYILDDDRFHPRPLPIIPVENITRASGEVSKETTAKLSFKPVTDIVKPKPIIPKSRIRYGGGPIENNTTIRLSFTPKFVPKPRPFVPSANIKTPQGSFESQTTTLLSFAKPSGITPVQSFKPQISYRRPSAPCAKETTQKLSFVPLQIGAKENYAWAQKPAYRKPSATMPTETTYTKCYFEVKDVKREQPIIPKGNSILPDDEKFSGKTCYSETFKPCQPEPQSPFVPSDNIIPSKNKMLCDTTNKLSFRPVQVERPRPILPRPRKLLSDSSPFPIKTTNQLSYDGRTGERSLPIIPPPSIVKHDQPFDDKTTTALSFPNPERVNQVPNFKPKFRYSRPTEKVDGETVNKLSFPRWEVKPKDEVPWANKPKYKLPSNKMAGDSTYQMSFPAPGHYTDDEEENGGNESERKDL